MKLHFIHCFDVRCGKTNLVKIYSLYLAHIIQAWRLHLILACNLYECRNHLIMKGDQALSNFYLIREIILFNHIKNALINYLLTCLITIETNYNMLNMIYRRSSSRDFVRKKCHNQNHRALLALQSLSFGCLFFTFFTLTTASILWRDCNLAIYFTKNYPRYRGV